MKLFALGASSLLLAASLAACGDEASRVPGGQEWPTGEPLAVEGLVWAKDHTVHLGDGTTLDTKHSVHEFAVAGDAVWFTREDPVHADQVGDEGRLWRATTEGVERTDAYAAELTATIDGRFLVYLDHVTGPKDDGTAAYVLVVIDTRTGEETIRTTEGMDDAGAVSLEDAYGEGEPHLAGATDSTAYVTALGSTRAFDLETGEVERVDSDDVPGASLDDPLWNPAHTWRTGSAGSPLRPALIAEDGRPVPLRMAAAQWSISGWVDDETVVGTASGGKADPVSAIGGFSPSSLITCTLPAGTCSRVPGSTRTSPDVTVLLPSRARS